MTPEPDYVKVTRATVRAWVDGGPVTDRELHAFRRALRGALDVAQAEAADGPATVEIIVLPE
jgi:hypothetical protein